MIKEIIAEKTAVEISPRSGGEECRASGVKTSSVRLSRIQTEFSEKIKAPPAAEKEQDMKRNIGCISGDGIGPEIVREAKKVLDAIAVKYGHEISYTEILLGGRVH